MKTGNPIDQNQAVMKKMSFYLMRRPLLMAWLLLLAGLYGQAQETATGLLAGRITGDKSAP